MMSVEISERARIGRLEEMMALLVNNVDGPGNSEIMTLGAETSRPVFSAPRASVLESATSLARMQALLVGQIGAVLFDPFFAFPIELTRLEEPGKASVQAGYLAAVAQLEIGTLKPQIEAIDTSLTAEDFRDATRSPHGALQDVLDKGKNAVGLAAGVAVAAKKFDDAFPEIEKAIASFVEAQSKLSLFQSRVLAEGADMSALNTQADREAFKQLLTNPAPAPNEGALEKITTDLGHVKGALRKIDT